MNCSTTIQLNRDALPIAVPVDYTGPLTLPATGRTVWWTGRVAIGLHHQTPHLTSVAGQSAQWIQSLLLESRATA